MSKEYSIYAVKSNRSSDDFLPIALDYLVNQETPMDIFEKSDFKKIENGFVSVATVSGNVTTSYNGLFGTDRKVQYTAYQNGKAVTRTKTVTDWNPISGSLQFSGTGCCILSDTIKKRSFSPDILSGAVPYEADKKETMGEARKVSDEDFSSADSDLIRNAENSAESQLFYSYHNKLKDMHYSSTISGEKYSEYIIPSQILPFSYKNQEYAVSAFSRTESGVDGFYPSDSDAIDKALKEKMHYKITRPLFINLALIPIFAAAMFFLIKAQNTVGEFLPSILPVVQLIYYFVCHLKGKCIFQ